MATFKKFEDTEAWKKARELTREVYRHSKVSPFSKDFGLRDQIRRAAVSGMSNIAEGFERGGTKEFMQFLAIAKGSVGELEAQLYVALDQSYINERGVRLSQETCQFDKAAHRRPDQLPSPIRYERCEVQIGSSGNSEPGTLNHEP
jgi:four helix bundle protein